MPNVRDEPRLGRLALQASSRRHVKKTSNPRARARMFFSPHINNTKSYFERQPNGVESKIKGPIFAVTKYRINRYI